MRTCIFSRELLKKISQQTSSAPNRRTIVNPALINNIKELTIKDDRKFFEAAIRLYNEL